MNSDIILDNEIVHISATDLRLDAGSSCPDRRTNTTPYRRALVHDFGDKLTINYGKDYPAGVKIEGWLECSGPDLKLDAGSSYPDRRINTTPYRRALVHDFGDKLTINYEKDYPAGVKIEGQVEMGDSLKVNGPDVSFDQCRMTVGRQTTTGAATFESNAQIKGELKVGPVLGKLSGGSGPSVQNSSWITIKGNAIVLTKTAPHFAPLGQPAEAKSEESIDLVKTIMDLQAKVAALEKKLGDLLK